MELVELNEKEFKTIADKSEQISFHQTKNWANLKKINGWDSHYIGLKDKNKVVCASLLLSKTLPIIKKKMFYSPRGFLIDYTNKKILTEWTTKLKEYVKKQKGIFVKIDPYVSYQERDNNGDIVENGKNNKEAHKNLLDLGYKHFGFNLMQDTLQPRWMHVIEINGRNEEEESRKLETEVVQRREKGADGNEKTETPAAESR